MSNKKYLFFLILFIFILPSLVFAFDYTEIELGARKTEMVTYEADNGTKVTVEAVSKGENVKCYSDENGLIANEHFIGTDGALHFPGENVIVYDENGFTGNFKNEGDVTFNDGDLKGQEANPYFETLCKVIVGTVEDGVVGFNDLYVSIGNYVGDIFQSTQDFVNFLNENGLGTEALKLYGFDKWTIESYNEICQEIGEQCVFYNQEILTQLCKPVWQDGKYICMGIDITSIVGIEAFGTKDRQVQLALFYRLYCIDGGNLSFEEWAEKYQKDKPDEPEPDNPGGTESQGEGGQWSDRGVASVSANVWSDQYDVSSAIPTSENVNGSISASDMSWYYNVKKDYDSQDYTISSVTLHWGPYWYWVTPGYEDAKGNFIQTGAPYQELGYRYSATESVTGTYTTHYFAVAEAHMNKLGGGSVSNDAVGTLASLGAANIGGGISRDGGIIFDEGRMDTSSFHSYGEGKGDAIGAAKGVIRARIKDASKVKNDTLIIKSTVLWGVTEDWGDEFKATPYDSPSHLVSPSSEMKSSSGVKMIPSDKANGNYASSASASYPMVPGFDGQGTYSKGAGAPSVFVWTPVVNNSTITPEAFINQKVVKESGVTYLQLDKGFTINIPDNGIHISTQGYGSRNYNSYQAVPKTITNWGKIKDVKVPFDAYLQPSNTLIKAGKWLSDYGLATAQNSYTFLVPVWSEEAKGNIETRVVAENTSSYVNGSSCPEGLIQDGANLSYTRYIAEKKIPVEVIGKIYDLRISSTNDPGWPGIKGKDGAYVSSPEFPFGQAGQNAMSQYKYAPKLGYLVEFDFKTKGVKTDNVDVSIQPEGFYFIGKNGGNSEKVDLYFKTVTNQYVKIEPGTNNSDIIVNLSNPFMRVAQSELIDSTRIMKQQVKVLYTYAQDVLIGKLPNLNIPEKLRLCYNNFTEYATEYPTKLYGKSEAAIANDANGGLSYSTGKYDQVNNGRDTVIASVGHWYAAYRLPSSTIAVPPGKTPKDFMKNPNLIKKNGYILVKFDIVGKNGDEDYLRYTGPESIMEPGEYEKNPDGSDKQWQDPGPDNPNRPNPEQPVKLPNNKPGTIPDGTVILFETDWRANNDSEVIGTH